MAIVLPIYAYGNPVLKKKAVKISADYPKLGELIENMFETMYNANGVGLAAPQVGLGIRLFLVDASPFAEDEEEDGEDLSYLEDFKKVFINPEIYEESGEDWGFTEGCLSIPDIREEVIRQPKIRIKYMDENFQEFDEEYEGFAARVIQHEYDHVEGILFTDKINPMRRRLLESRLKDIAKGKARPDYRMFIPGQKGRR
ncbi:MAG: peptide deformylase [Luteibaculaceae bacterium]|jgi:peptide deformylase